MQIGMRAVVVCGAGLLFAASGFLASESRVAADDAKHAGGVPVEKDMHEFMEYYFEPTFKRLKPAIAQEPADKAGWKPLKAEGLIFAEGGNLLLARTPKEDAAEWNELSLAVRDAGEQLYQAAKKREYPAARKAYETMISKCNACHQHFAEGEHQLEP
jgi:hypothetical protein